MDINIIKILKCIKCGNAKFHLKVNSKVKENIVEGNLLCRKCRNSYSIKSGILITLPKDLSKLVKCEKDSSDKYSNVENFSYIKSKSIKFFYNNQFRYINKFKKANTIIEIGCGNGYFLNYLINKKFGFKLIVGVDLSFNALLNAKKRTKLNNLVQADSNNLPFIDDVFDNIAIQGVLHHLKTPIITLKEMERILRENGIIIIQDKNFNNFLIPFINKVIIKLILKEIGEATLIKNPINHRKVIKFLDKNGFRIDSFKFHDIIAWPSSRILNFLKLNTNSSLLLIVNLDNLLSKIPIVSNIFSWRYTILAKKTDINALEISNWGLFEWFKRRKEFKLKRRSGR